MKNEALFIGLAFFVGIFVGAIGMDIFNGKSEPNSTASNVQQSGAVAPVNFDQNIKMLKELVIKEPQNRNAWVQLGNAYFDINRFLESIESYDKALELDGNDPNVLTDQGVMYRKLGWFDKALENFNKANSVAPNHAQSVYNAYIVYRQDLNDFAGAKKAALRYLAILPNGPASAQLKADLEFMDTHPATTPQ
jgi:tetratricopeptide (TPR) repeat protein